MTAIRKFATSAIAPPERLRFWNDLVDRIYTGTYVNSASPAFSGEMLAWNLGDLAMIRPRSTASAVGRLADTSGEERVILHLQCRGSSLHRQGTAESLLEPGDFVLGTPHTPYALELTAHELLVVEFPRAPLLDRFPGLDDAMSRRLSGASPGGRVFHDFLLSLWRQGDQSDADPDWQDGVSGVFYDLVAMALRGAGGASRGAGNPHALAAETALRERVLAQVAANLCDPALRTVTLAQACNTSVRTIQNLFATLGTTPSAYILEQRLRLAADRLSVGGFGSITELAFELGFNDSAYFTRCFRQRHGQAPRDWRRAVADEGAAPQS
ncbi:helix-turn-helix domain-containing protein [Novosphingobium sp.]|uniref:helix-turn-helix domain-containing protein n=1 Tax=Novosphingobium sp. TaxID=1874826 RepID=UPI0038BD9600